MKALNVLIIGLFTTFLLTNVVAGNNKHLKVDIKAIPGSQKMNVNLIGLNGETLIQLKDEGEVVLLQQLTQETEYNKILDLSALMEGEYSLIILSGNKEILQSVFVQNGELEIPFYKRKIYFSPVVRVHGSKVDISWFNGKIADMKVRISDHNGSIIFADDIKNVIKVEKRYNLEQVISGNYTIAIDTPRRTYYENVTIE